MPYKDIKKRRATQKAYREQNLDESRQTRNEWRASNLETRRAYDSKYAKEHPEKVMLMRAKARAKKHGWEFSIEESDVVIPDVCPILGIPLQQLHGDNKSASPSLDRIDNTKGYVKGNVWVISWRANTLKNNATLDELEKLVTVLRNKIT